MAQAPASVRFTPTALADYERLDGSQVRIVDRALERIAAEPERGKPLAGDLAGLRSERTASMRIVYRASDGGGLIIVAVVAIGHRARVYGDLARRRARLARELAALDAELGAAQPKRSP